MEWQVTNEEVVHDSKWMKLILADVTLPNGEHIVHRVIRYPGPTAGVLIHDKKEHSVLLIWRHRFITSKWGWEIPAGLADPDESPESAAAREAVEETGCEPTALQHLITMNTSSGLMDETFHSYFSDQWRGHANQSATIEADRVEWIPVTRLDQLIERGEIPHAHSLVTVLAAQRRGLLTS